MLHQLPLEHGKVATQDVAAAIDADDALPLEHGKVATNSVTASTPSAVRPLPLEHGKVATRESLRGTCAASVTA